MMSPTQSYDFCTHVLGLKGDAVITVVAMEMDIWGFGETVEEAIWELQFNLSAQVSFALEYERIDMLDRRVSSEYFAEYDECRIATQRGVKVSDKFIYSLAYPNVEPGMFESVSMVTSDNGLVFEELKQHDERYELHRHIARSDHRILFHPSVNQRAESYPLLLNRETGKIPENHLEVIKRRFKLPTSLLNKL